MVHHRRLRQANLADDLCPKLQSVIGILPSFEREFRPNLPARHGSLLLVRHLMSPHRGRRRGGWQLRVIKGKRLIPRQRNELGLVARHLPEASGLPVGLGLFDALRRARHEIPPDMPRPVIASPPNRTNRAGSRALIATASPGRKTSIWPASNTSPPTSMALDDPGGTLFMLRRKVEPH